MFDKWVNFWITRENLEKSERRVPIYSIYNTLNEEQLSEIEKWDLIRVSLLNREQLDRVNEALSFDYQYNKIWNDTSYKIHSHL